MCININCHLKLIESLLQCIMNANLEKNLLYPPLQLFSDYLNVVFISACRANFALRN